jgi:hypothetical protein
MLSAAALVHQLGGPLAVARRVGVGRQGVYHWMRLGVIPPKYYLAFREWAAEAEVELPASLFREVPRNGRER